MSPTYKPPVPPARKFLNTLVVAASNYILILTSVVTFVVRHLFGKSETEQVYPTSNFILLLLVPQRGGMGVYHVLIEHWGNSI